jgi:hypothetical protein
VLLVVLLLFTTTAVQISSQKVRRKIIIVNEALLLSRYSSFCLIVFTNFCPSQSRKYDCSFFHYILFKTSFVIPKLFFDGQIPEKSRVNNFSLPLPNGVEPLGDYHSEVSAERSFYYGVPIRQFNTVTLQTKAMLSCGLTTVPRSWVSSSS